jgi:hypothetical protein
MATRNLKAVPDDDAEALLTDREAVSKLETVDAFGDPTDEDEESVDLLPGERTAEPPTFGKPETAVRRGPVPPASLGTVMLEVGCRLKGVSLGKPVANVTASLTFELDVPQEVKALMGEHAYAGVFNEGFVGEGITVKGEATASDPENRVTQKVKVAMPRFDSMNRDQITTNILPLIEEDGSSLDGLLGAIGPTWRLNCGTDIPGVLRLHRMQESLQLADGREVDLTKKAE